MTDKAPSPRAKSDGKNSCRPGTNVVQTPVEPPVAREVDADELVDNSRKMSRFGAVYTDFERFQNEKRCRDLSDFTRWKYRQYSGYSLYYSICWI